MFKKCLHFLIHFVLPLTIVLSMGILAIQWTVPNEKEVAIQPFSSRAQNGEGAVLIMNGTKEIWKYVVIVKNNSSNEWRKQTLIISADRMSAMKVFYPKSNNDAGFSIYPVMAFKIKVPVMNLK